MTVLERSIQARGTFDQRREKPMPCRCGVMVTGWADCMAGAPCVLGHEQPHVGRWGVLWREGGEA